MTKRVLVVGMPNVIDRAVEKKLDLGGGLDLDIRKGALDLGGSKGLPSEQQDTRPTTEPVDGQSYEAMHAEQASELRTSFMQRAADDKARFIEATDSEYWFAVCFRTRDQKEAFLAAVQWPGVEPDDKYVHGEDIAKALNITLPPARFTPPGEKPNRDMVKLGLIGDE